MYSKRGSQSLVGVVRPEEASYSLTKPYRPCNGLGRHMRPRKSQELCCQDEVKDLELQVAKKNGDTQAFRPTAEEGEASV